MSKISILKKAIQFLSAVSGIIFTGFVVFFGFESSVDSIWVLLLVFCVIGVFFYSSETIYFQNYFKSVNIFKKIIFCFICGIILFSICFIYVGDAPVLFKLYAYVVMVVFYCIMWLLPLLSRKN